MAVQTSSDETRAIFAAFIGGCGGLFLLLVVWKLRRKLSCCLSGRKEPSQAEVLRFAAQLYAKELTDSEPTRFLLNKVRKPTFGPAADESEFTIRAARTWSPLPPQIEVEREGSTALPGSVAAQGLGQQHPFGSEARKPMLEDRLPMGAGEPAMPGSSTSVAIAPSSPVHTWAELGITTLEESETRLHRLASFLTGKGLSPRHSQGGEQGDHADGGFSSRAQSRLGDHSTSFSWFSLGGHEASQWGAEQVLPKYRHTTPAYTGSEKPPALPSAPRGQTSGSSTSPRQPHHGWAGDASRRVLLLESGEIQEIADGPGTVPAA